MSRSEIEFLVWGVHPVLEALVSKTARVHKIFIADSIKSETKERILEHTQEIRLKELHKKNLSQKCGTEKHQNVAAWVSLSVWKGVEAWGEEENPSSERLILALDGIQDPQNLGGLFRSAHFFQVDAIILSKNRSCPITGTVAKASTGALFSVGIIRPTNLARCLQEAQSLGFFCYGLDAGASQALSSLGSLASQRILVIGAEGEGLRELTRKQCDVLVRLTDSAGRDSLNASVAGAIALYEMRR